MKSDFQAIVKQFKFEGDFVDIRPYGLGHINDTYLAAFKHNVSTQRYILQKINDNVFRNPEELMRNIEAVTSHLSKKIESLGGDPRRETLTLIPTVDDNFLLHTDSGDYWRGYLFINNARTYEFVESMDHVYNAAKAFGNFQNLLSDYPSDQLIETIPDFHHTLKRFETFIAAVDKDQLNRAGSVNPETKFILQREKEAPILVDMLAHGELPERITHNDTKFNNVMIDDQTGVGVCVIDLDTVMPGLSLYDFGDAIRTLANPAAEDEIDLSLVELDLTTFDYYTRGYLEAVGDVLTPAEINHLPFSAILMTLECGIRFLTDYLEGDKYFKIHRENQNLDRCRTQFKLVEEMEANIDQMARIIDNYR